MKKISYNLKTREELIADLKNLRSSLHAKIVKSPAAKNSKEYTSARKNIARVLTALNSKSSTETEK